MNKETMEQIDALLSGSEGALSSDAFAELQHTLKTDAAALRHYCQQAEIHGRLEWELGDPNNQLSTVYVPSAPVQKPKPAHSQPLVWASAAVIVLTLTLVLKLGSDSRKQPSAQTTHNSSPASNETGKPVATPVARITKSSNAEWQSTSTMENSWLVPGTLSLLTGSVEISFDSGARVILQGPAKLHIITARKARLTRGMATTHIPPQAVGFKLETPSTTFSDQDSSFAVAVADDGSTEVHVIRGLIEATPRANPRLAKMLSDKESLRLTNKTILTNSRERHSIHAFTQELPSSQSAKPSQYLHWSMDKAKQEKVAETGNHSGASFPASMHARPGTSTHASADFIKGRFGNAIQFNGRGAFLSSGFPGIPGSQARTVAFWVRIAPGTLKKQAYSMVAWGMPQAQSGGKWQIAWNYGADNRGTPGALRTEFGGGYVIGSTDLRDGRWHHVAVVFLGGKSVDVSTHIRQYVDGRLENVSAAKSKIINTWITPDKALPTYFGRRLENDLPTSGFKGALDEIYIFPTALTPAQINRLYLDNHPPSDTVLSAQP